MNTADPRLYAYNIDTVAGWLTFTWQVEGDILLTTMRQITEMDTSKSGVEALTHPTFYIIKRENKPLEIYMDSTQEGKCENIRPYQVGP